MAGEWRADDLIEGRYRLIRDLRDQRGAFGVVWLAEEIRGARQQVVIKIPRQLPGEDLQALRNEVDLWSRAIPHPNILPILDVLTDPYICIVSPYIPSGTLQTRLPDPFAESSPTLLMPQEQALHIMDGILAGIEQLHRLCIVHLDLKPGNILMLYDVPQLMDFGMARTLGPNQSRRTATHQTAGTWHYMAPEQIGNRYKSIKAEHAYQTDLWAAGVIFQQLLTGSLPFPEPGELVLSHISSLSPQPLPESIPEPYRQIVERALQKDRRQRYTSATEMRAALHRAREAVRHIPLQSLRADRDRALVSLEQAHTRVYTLDAQCTDLENRLRDTEAREKLASTYVANAIALKTERDLLERELSQARSHLSDTSQQLAKIKDDYVKLADHQREDFVDTEYIKVIAMDCYQILNRELQTAGAKKPPLPSSTSALADSLKASLESLIQQKARDTVQLSSKIEALESQLKTAGGSLESLTNKNKELSKKAKATHASKTAMVATTAISMTAALSLVSFAYWSFDAWGLWQDEKLAWIHYHRGQNFLNQRKYRSAEVAFRESVRLRAQDALYNSHLGDSLYHQNRYKEAERFYTASIKNAPDNPEYWNNLGLSVSKQKNYTDAEKSYNKAIDLAPTNGLYFANLASVQLRLNKRTDAHQNARKAKELGFKDVWLFKELGL